MITVSQSMNELEEKKSKFLAYIFPITSEEEAKSHIQALKKEHYKARHHCSAYRLLDENGREVEHSSDDGEPSGTAGKPMLELLRHEDLQNVLVVVVRYFGGIKLGTGGLVRAYSGAVKKALASNQYIEIKHQVIYNLSLDYSLYDSLIYYLDQKHLDYGTPIYMEKITLPIYVDEIVGDAIEEELNHQFQGKLTIHNQGIKEVKIPING